MDIQEQKRNMEFFIDSDAILSTIIEENAYIFDIDIMTQNISAIKGENLSLFVFLLKIIHYKFHK